MLGVGELPGGPYDGYAAGYALPEIPLGNGADGGMAGGSGA